MTTSKVAVIGLGNIGQAVAGNFAQSNTAFIAADRSIAKAKELSSQWASAQPADIATAVKEAGIVILAIPFVAIADFLHQYAADLKGKIIIDPSNPIAPDANGGFKKIIGAGDSAGQINAGVLPENAKLAKAFGTLGVASLKAAAYQAPQQAVLFYATDYTSINSTVEQLIEASGFTAVNVGGLDQSIRIEVFGDLHEFGALGKTVTIEEASSKL